MADFLRAVKYPGLRLICAVGVGCVGVTSKYVCMCCVLLGSCVLLVCAVGVTSKHSHVLLGSHLNILCCWGHI